jgi:hypothetical protein
MATFIENRIINLNVENAIQQNGDFLSSVFFQFNGLLKDEADVQNVYISFQNAQFPFSFYNVNIYNNVLRISADSNPAVNITLTRGNYNANTLITEIQNQLTAAGISITIAISSTTGRFTFTKSGGTFTFFSSGSTCFKILGFDPALNYTSTAAVLLAPYPCNLLGTLKLRVASYDLPISSIDSSVNGSLNILASIPINSGNFGLIMYENTNNIQNTLNLRVLDGFDLEVLDDDGNLINFNGCYWTITMMLSVERLLPERSTTGGFSDITRMQMQEAAAAAASAARKEEPPLEISEEEIADPDANNEIYVEPPNLEETIPADDLDLLLYGAGIR